jgi:DNA primase
MNLDADVIAPNSENTILSEDLIIEFKQVYEGIVTVFDSDLAGIKAMQTYKSKYRLPFVYLPLEKDIADIVKIHGVQRAMIELVPKLCKAYEEYDLLQES